MSDQATQEESQETGSTETQTESTGAEQEVTLDDVYRSAGLETQTTQTQEKPQQQNFQPQTQQAPPQIPDAFDTEAFRQFQANQRAGLQATAQAVSQLANHLTQIQQREMQAQVKKDVGQAVEVVNKIVGHPKTNVIEAMLDAKARENPKFQALWQNRAAKPDAWDSALKAVAREFAKDLDVKTDANLVNAQQARKTAQRQMATTAAEPNEDVGGKLQGADFDRYWEQLKGG